MMSGIRDRITFSECKTWFEMTEKIGLFPANCCEIEKATFRVCERSELGSGLGAFLITPSKLQNVLCTK